jgi:hypothetical protein
MKKKVIAEFIVQCQSAQMGTEEDEDERQVTFGLVGPIGVEELEFDAEKYKPEDPSSVFVKLTANEFGAVLPGHTYRFRLEEIET